jgi:hypothetical protein
MEAVSNSQIINVQNSKKLKMEWERNIPLQCIAAEKFGGFLCMCIECSEIAVLLA